MTNMLPSPADYTVGFEAVNELAIESGGALEAMRGFRDRTRNHEGVYRNLTAAAFQMLNLEPMDEGRTVDKAATITRLALMGYTLGLMVNEQIYPQYLSRLRGGGAFKAGSVEDETEIEPLKSRVSDAGGLETQEGQLFITLALAKDGLSRIGTRGSEIAYSWDSDATARGVDASLVADESKSRLEAAFKTGLGYSLNKAYWEAKHVKPTTVVVVDPIWLYQT